MQYKSILTTAFLSAALMSQAQRVDGTTGDMRNFAAQTQVVLQRNPFDQKNNTVGSQYLFPGWVPGTLITNDNQKFTAYKYNFDKVGQGLYRVQEDSTVYLIDKGQIKYLSLGSGEATYEFEKVPAAKNDQLYRIVAKGSKYTLYSLTKTKFVPSNFSSNGIVSSGNMYDEFKDEVSYYIVTADGMMKPLSLKKKAVLAAFESDKPAVEKYFKDNWEAELNENFLKALTLSLNP